MTGRGSHSQFGLEIAEPSLLALIPEDIALSKLEYELSSGVVWGWWRGEVLLKTPVSGSPSPGKPKMKDKGPWMRQ